MQQQRICFSMHLIALCIGLFGICGNITAFIGFQRQPKKSSTSFLFQTLAITDSFVLIFFCPFGIWQGSGYPYIPDSVVYFSDYLLSIADTFNGFGKMAIVASNGTTVILTITRFIAVCFPLHASRQCSMTRVRYYLIAIIVFSISFHLQHFIKLSLNHQRQYFHVWTPIVHFVAPLLIITTLTVILIVKLNYMSKQRTRMTRKVRQINNTTRVLIIVNIVFTICSLPWPLYLVITINEDTPITMFVFNIAIPFFFIVNSSVNFLIYTIFSKQYRAAFKQNIHCSCVRSSIGSRNMRQTRIRTCVRETPIYSSSFE